MKILIIYLILIFYSNIALANNIIIKVRINNEIITNIDIDHEKKYLIFLNPKLKELEEVKIDEIAKKSLITELVKKKELKELINFEENTRIIEVLEKSFFKKKGIKNKKEFLEILKKKELNYLKIKDKLQIEGLWNQLIYKKYFNNIKINKEELRLRIRNSFKEKKEKHEYNLSEIVFTENENTDDLINKIIKNINTVGFENSANIFSISNTAKNGGLIGWISEIQISEKINQNIKNLEIEKFTNPIKIPGGYIIIKINDKRVLQDNLNEEDQLKRLISQETNRQLNNFSIIYYKRLKKNLEINDY